MTMRINEVMEFEIMNLTTKGEGVTFLPDGKTIIISGCNDKDEVVKAKIKKIGAVVVMAEKVSRVRSPEAKTESVELEGSPYELDEEDDDDVDDDDEYED